ncbi:hypothetical protein COLO4_35881 [Corchorus olitorius]|uniref:Uncharacterized protein n=1 Tax=Corchorus olitorius TaxID=93759 RepID=A0A1R3GC91_9ROSI|nr:hypothetical protein COLO4_35881 [Corchorus olitorius]
MREDESLCKERGQVKICCRIGIRIELQVSCPFGELARWTNQLMATHHWCQSKLNSSVR